MKKWFAIIAIISLLLVHHAFEITSVRKSHVLQAHSARLRPSLSDHKLQQLKIFCNWGGDGDDPQKAVLLTCPSHWTVDEPNNSKPKGLNLNGEKLLSIVCYSPERISEYISNYAKEQKRIGDRSFQVLTQEITLADTSGKEDTPTISSYTVRSYYYNIGEYYYNFTFFQNQQTPSVTLEEIEAVLETFEFVD